MFRDKLPLPIGEDFYKKAVTEYFTVDKTLMIKDVIDANTQVALFTRPRRFGKTLNMDMLRTFFEKTDEDNSVYFKDKLIWQEGEKYTKEQGKYPVIWLTLKNEKCLDWPTEYNSIKLLISGEYKRYRKIVTETWTESEKLYFDSVLNCRCDISELQKSLAFLTEKLSAYYGENTIVIIDEYDMVIQAGYTSGYFREAVSFIRNLFSGAFKNNPCLKYGFLTGIMRIAKENIFSGLNNLRVYSTLDTKFSEYFGFTKDDIWKFAEYYECEDKVDEIAAWYDGYRFGNTEIYNPWSVICYIDNNCTPDIYWVSTSSNDIIKELLAACPPEIDRKLKLLYEGEKLSEPVDISIIYEDVKQNISNIFSFLLITGYLKATGSHTYGDMTFYDLEIPNKELHFVYKKEILARINSYEKNSLGVDIIKYLGTGDIASFEEQLKKFLLLTASFYDTENESFYHGLMLGFCGVAGDFFEISSNREAGYGRFDIQLKPKYDYLPGYVFELKKATKSQSLNTVARYALSQIEKKQYYAGLQEAGVKNIVKIGMAFRGKEAAVKSG